MSMILTCTQGHHWEHVAAADTVEGAVELRCPQCGALVLVDFATPPPDAADPGASGEDLPLVPGYQILRRLDRGGMGEVFKALQVSLNRLVALKIIRTRELATGRERERFQTEAHAVARLDHPHIVRIYDCSEHQGLSYFSMEFVDGGNLAQRLRQVRPSPAEAAHLVETLARAMHHAHVVGIVHRDLKPANVLLTRTGVPKIADFGLARLLDEIGQTQSGVRLGTASYMPPEQAEGRLQDVRETADVYSLGAILYEMLTGRPPFAETSRDLTIYHVITSDPVPPGQLNPAVPPPLEAICLRCLEKHPGQRYPSALALAEDLHRFQHGEPLLIEPVSEWERQTRWARRAGYELLELVGCSSLGLLYKARQLSLGRLVMLKTIAPRAQTQALRERFRREAETAAHTDHPNIVKIYDFGEVQGQPYFSLEYMEGGTLADRLRGEPLPYKEALQTVLALARAVHHAHRQGILHGDLRPFNIQLTVSGVPKIQGFGLGRLLTVDDDRWFIRGLSSYMAPEQAGRGEEVAEPTDVYALGAILYEMLTGRPPIIGDTVEDTVARIRNEVPVPLLQLQPGLPSRLQRVCERCLCKDWRQRYDSAEALADEVRRILAGEQTLTDEFDLIPGYELQDELGSGGLSIVYRGRQVSLDRPVAVKLFRERVGSVQAVHKALSRLSHPNLVRVFDCGERDGTLYVVEELVVGGTLARRLRVAPQPPRDAARLVAVLARAMHHAHQNGIVHRNLKPSLILFDEHGTPRISGFDLARLADRPGDEAGLFGTLNYMAPEQALQQLDRIGPATDVHGLGLILHEALTGRPLWTAIEAQEAWRQVVEGERPPTGVHEALDAVCLRALAREPEERYPTALALAEALEGLFP